MQNDTITNMQEEAPTMLSLGREHLAVCRACTQVASGHSVGLRRPLEDVQIEQSLEAATNILSHTQELLGEVQKTIGEIQVFIAEIQKLYKPITTWKEKGLLGALIAVGSALGTIVGLFI